MIITSGLASQPGRWGWASLRSLIECQTFDTPVSVCDLAAAERRIITVRRRQTDAAFRSGCGS